MFGSNPFVSSFQSQNNTGQNTWSSGPQNTQNGQNQQWGGYQPWGMNNNLGGAYSAYGTSSSMSPTTGGAGSLSNPGGVTDGGPYGGWNPSQGPTYNTGGVDRYSPYGNAPSGNSPYSPYPYGMAPTQNTGGGYTPNGWMPGGQQQQLPPWLQSGNSLGGMRGGSPTGSNVGTGTNPLSRFPGAAPNSGAISGSTDPTSNTYGMASFGDSNPMNRGSGGLSGGGTSGSGQNQPYQFQNQGGYNPGPNTNNPAAYFQNPSNPTFIPDITARMLGYADRGYSGSNGLYMNPDGTWSF